MTGSRTKTEATSARLYTLGMLRRSSPARWMGIWLAIASILLLNLLPTFSRLADPARATEWVELCRGKATFWVNVADVSGKSGERSTPTAPDHLFKHCPYCALHVDMDVPAMALLQVPAMDAWAALLPAAFLHAPRTQHAWRSAQPRAPPQRV